VDCSGVLASACTQKAKRTKKGPIAPCDIERKDERDGIIRFRTASMEIS